MISKFLIYFAAIALSAWFVPGIRVESGWGLCAMAALLALINTIVRPVMTFLSFPLVVLTGGLFLLVINALTILLADALVPGIDVQSFLGAVCLSLIIFAVWLVTR